MQFDPVWVSSDAQIAALTHGYVDAPLPTKLLGTYSPEPGVAHLQGILMPWMRIAAVYITEGRVTFDGGGFEFVPRPSAPFGWRFCGGDSELTFRLEASEIIAVEPADFSSPVARFFDIPFTRVRTKGPGQNRDLLLCVGGRINMPRIRARSLELRQALTALGGTSDPALVATA